MYILGEFKGSWHGKGGLFGTPLVNVQAREGGLFGTLLVNLGGSRSLPIFALSISQPV